MKRLRFVELWPRAASVTSHLNLAVRLVETFAGEELATMTAKALLIDMNRTSQTSFATLLDEHGHTDTHVARPAADGG